VRSVDNQYFVGFVSSCGHSISSHSSAALAETRTRTLAKRPLSFSFVPCRQPIVRHASSGRVSATLSTLMRMSTSTLPIAIFVHTAFVDLTPAT